MPLIMDENKPLDFLYHHKQFYDINNPFDFICPPLLLLVTVHTKKGLNFGQFQNTRPLHLHVIEYLVIQSTLTYVNEIAP